MWFIPELVTLNISAYALPHPRERHNGGEIAHAGSNVADTVPPASFHHVECPICAAKTLTRLAAVSYIGAVHINGGLFCRGETTVFWTLVLHRVTILIDLPSSRHSRFQPIWLTTNDNNFMVKATLHRRRGDVAFKLLFFSHPHETWPYKQSLRTRSSATTASYDFSVVIAIHYNGSSVPRAKT